MSERQGKFVTNGPRGEETRRLSAENERLRAELAFITNNGCLADAARARRALDIEGKTPSKSGNSEGSGETRPPIELHTDPENPYRTLPVSGGEGSSDE